MATAPVPTSELGYVAPSWVTTTGRNATAWGWPTDEAEESAAWQWPTSIATADRMSRHPQVQALWLAITFPLRADIWALDPQDADPARVEMLADDLDLPVLDERGRIPDRRQRKPSRRRGRFSWAEHLRLQLLHLRWGSMWFVQQYDADALDQTGMARLRKLAPRFPRTLSHIDVAADGGLVGIRQYANGPGGEIPIGVDRLVAYVHDREGANWAGRSLLRALYRPFELADRLERVEAMTGERNGMGVPSPEWVGGAGLPTPDQGQVDAANAVAQAWRAGDFASAAMPPGWRMRLVGVDGTLPDLDKPISRHYGLMAKAVQAMFMELGSTQGGHRALGETFVERFDSAIGGLADSMASDVMTPHIVEDWWDLNFGPDDPSPAVVVSPGEVPVESIMALVQAGLIVRDDALEDWLRDRLHLPGRAATSTVAPANLGFLPGVPPVAASSGKSYGRRREILAAKPDWPQRIADAFAAVVDADAIAAAIEAGTDPAEAVAAGLAEDLTPVASVLADLWGASWETGVRRAQSVLPTAAARPVLAALGDVLRYVGDLATSVVSSLRDRLTTAVVAATADAVPARSILSDLLHDVATDTTAADRIAATESHRMITAAAVDTWKAAGVGEFEWSRNSGSDEDDECADRDGTTGNWDDLPPIHVGCQCEVHPA